MRKNADHPEQDKKIAAFVEKNAKNPQTYFLGGNNCTNFVTEALRAGGVGVYTDSPIPNLQFWLIGRTTLRKK